MEAGTDEHPPQDAVRLRPWAEHDLDLLRRVNAPDMTAHLGGPESNDEVVARHAKYLRLWGEGGARMFVIEAGGQATGTIGWWDTEHEGAPAAEAGWSVLPEFQRRGIARQALRLLARDAATHSMHGLLVAFPGTDNAASNALCRSTGFTRTGSGVEPWRGGELAFHVWVLDISNL